MKKDNKGISSLILVFIISGLFISFLTLFNFQPPILEKENIDFKKAIKGIELGVDDGNYRFLKNKNFFISNLNGCSSSINGSIPVKYEERFELNNFFDINTNFLYSSDLLEGNNFVNNYGFLNRNCSLYAKSYPYNGNEDLIIKGNDIILPLNTIEDNYYYLKFVDREYNKGFVFTSNNLKDDNGIKSSSNISFEVGFNLLNQTQLDDYGNISYFQNTKKYNDILTLMSSKNLNADKKSVLGFFQKDLQSFSNNAKLELGLIEYDGNYSNGKENFEVNLSQTPKVIKRKICNTENNSGPNVCELKLSDFSESIKDNKVYFFYYKTYDKGTILSMRVKSGNQYINFLTGDLRIDLYGNGNEKLLGYNYTKENVLNEDLASSIFNYLYYSNN